MSREERREALLDAAARLVLDHGPDSVTMESISIEAGASKTLGYAYFANKDELLLALLEREVNDLDRRSSDRLVGAQDFEDLLRAGVGAWFDLVEERGPLLGALLQATAGSRDVAERTTSFSREQEQLYARVAVVQYGISEEVALPLVSILFAGLGAALVRWVESGRPRRDFEETYIQITLAALERLSGGLPS